jgi:polyferredoxin
MDRVGSPRGLIRYATENGVEQQLTRTQMLRRIGRPRVLIYGALLLAVGTAFAVSLSLRAPFHVDIVKDRGSLGRMLEDGHIENTYRVHVLNTGAAEHGFTVRAEALPPLRARWQAALRVAGGERVAMTLYLETASQPAQTLRGKAQPVTLFIERDDGVSVQAKASFYVPR